MEKTIITRIDHISIAVRDFRKAAAFFTLVLGAVPGVASSDKGLKFLAETFSLGDLSRLELMTATETGSFLDRFLAGREGVHHICLQTDDIKRARQRLDAEGVPYFGYNEYEGGGWKELFIHPGDAFGVLVQIAEFTPDDDFIGDESKLAEGARWRVEGGPSGVTLTLAHPGGGAVRMELTGDEAGRLAKDLQSAL